MHSDILMDTRILDEGWRNKYAEAYKAGHGFDDLPYVQCFIGNLLPTPSSLALGAEVFRGLERMAGERVVAVEVGCLGRPFLRGVEALDAVKKTLYRKGGLKGLKGMTRLSKHPELLKDATVQVYHIYNGGSLIRMRYDDGRDWREFTEETGVGTREELTHHGFYYEIEL